MEMTSYGEAALSLFDRTPTATLLCEPLELRVVRANAAAEALFGHTAGTLAGTACAALVADGPRLERALRDALDGNAATFAARLAARDGAGARVSCEVFRARSGVFVQFRPAADAMDDPLTGLPGPAVLRDRLDQALATARRYDYRFAILVADVDGFGTIVDRFGAVAGDWVIRVVARRVREALRRSDTVVRPEGDRFVVLMPVIASVEDAVDVAHKIVFAMHAPIALDGNALDVRLSIGIGVFPLDGDTRDALTHAANGALEDAKREARGLFRLATSSSWEPAT